MNGDHDRLSMKTLIPSSHRPSLLDRTVLSRRIGGVNWVYAAESRDYRMLHDVFTARCYASAVLAMGLYTSVCVRLCLSVTSQSSTKTAKRTITQTTPHDSPGILFSDAKDLREIRTESPPTMAPNAGWVGEKNSKLATFDK